MKLRWVLKLINGSMENFWVLRVDDITSILTSVDASYAIHRDMKSHTSGVVSFRTGGVLCKDLKQKIDTKSLSEAKLVEASDYLPYALWTKKFLASQGYTLTENVFYQDNLSTLCFQHNRRKLCVPNTRHINIRHFFMRDRLEIDNYKVRFDLQNRCLLISLQKCYREGFSGGLGLLLLAICT